MRLAPERAIVESKTKRVERENFLLFDNDTQNGNRSTTTVVASALRIANRQSSPNFFATYYIRNNPTIVQNAGGGQ
jgi:hypothetical protein